LNPILHSPERHASYTAISSALSHLYQDPPVTPIILAYYGDWPELLWSSYGVVHESEHPMAVFQSSSVHTYDPYVFFFILSSFVYFFIRFFLDTESPT